VHNIINTFCFPFAPTLCRILYGKMKLRLGKRSGGQNQGQERKNTLLTFITKFEPKEMNVFLDFIFESFLHFVSGQFPTDFSQCTHFML